MRCRLAAAFSNLSGGAGLHNSYLLIPISYLKRGFDIMFYYLSGTVAHVEPYLAVIDCGGVGYACRTTS